MNLQDALIEIQKSSDLVEYELRGKTLLSHDSRANLHNALSRLSYAKKLLVNPEPKFERSKNQHLVIRYPYIADKRFLGDVWVEFEVHYYFTWFFARVTPKRYKRETGPIELCGLQSRTNRMWIGTANALYWQLEDV